MAIDPELLAEAQRRGISVPAQPAQPAQASSIDPELLAEAKRRGIPVPQKSAEPSFADKLKGWGKLAARTDPFYGTYKAYKDPEGTKEWVKAGLEGLRQKDYTGKDTTAAAANTLGRYGPATAVAAAFPPALAEEAAVSAVPAAVRAIPYFGRAATGLAGLGTRMAVGGAEGGLASLAASTAAGDPNLQGSLDTADAFAKGEGLAKGIEVAAPPVWNAGKRLATGALERATALGSGVSPAAWETLRQFPEKVKEVARQGMTRTMENKPISKGLEAAQGIIERLKEQAGAIKDAAKERAGLLRQQAHGEASDFGLSAQSKVEQVASGAGKKYAAMMDHLAEDVSGDRWDVAGKVYDRMEPYLKTQGASLRFPVGEAETSASKGVMDVYDAVKGTLQEGMAPAQAAEYLQRLTAIQRSNLGKPAAAHAEQLKDAILQSLPGEYRFPTVDTHTPNGWNIRETRAEYANAKQLQRDLKKFTGAENVPATLERLEKSGGKTARALRRAMKSIPGFSDDLAAMRQARAAGETAAQGALDSAEPAIESAKTAAQPAINLSKAGGEFAPLTTRSLPRTGLVGSVATALNTASTPLAVAASPFALLGLTPRGAMETYLMAGKGAKALEGLAGKSTPVLPRVLAAYLAAKKKEK